MNDRMQRSVLVGFLGMLLGSAAQAAISWDFTCGSCSNTIVYGNTRSYSGSPAGSPGVTASAWANTVGASNTLIQDAYLGAYSGGLGVTNRDRLSGGGDAGEGTSPEHAMDSNDRYDSILFSFGSAVKLSQVKIGWMATDSDITLLAWTGSGSPTLAGASYGGLVSSGWTLAGHYSNVVAGTPRDVNAGSISSSYWLIGAYNPTVGSSTGWTTGNDYVKVASLYGSTSNKTPEPGVAALLVFGLFALTWKRRPAGAKK